jgi:hypothetical protein
VPEVDTAPLPDKTRVRLTEDLRGVPEGTAGTVRGVVGLAFPRHRVEFENGRFVTSVARSLLVEDGDWEQFQADRAAAAEKAAAPAPAPAAKAEPSDGDAAPANDRMAALLARSKAAREKKEAGG